jgi:hypothetical protein
MLLALSPQDQRRLGTPGPGIQALGCRLVHLKIPSALEDFASP